MVQEQPNYEVEVEGKQAVLIVAMQAEESMAGVDLDISDQRIRVKSENYLLEVEVSELVALMFGIDKKKAKIDSSSAKAKFRKKTRELRVTVTIL